MKNFPKPKIRPKVANILKLATKLYGQNIPKTYQFEELENQPLAVLMVLESSIIKRCRERNISTL